jgi:two-component system, NarL family, invasion response regulator UvrY
MTETRNIKIAMVDDHVLLRSALAKLINSFEGCTVVNESNNGIEMIECIKRGNIPDVVLLDLNMPEMDGYATALWLQQHHPGVRTLMLTMYDSELTLIRLLQAGVKGFLKKDVNPSELKYALNSVMDSGYYYSTHAAGKLANLFRGERNDRSRINHAMLSEQEIAFLKLACTDLTYKEIAQKMKLTPRTVDVLRDALFVKMDVKSRVGLAMVALKNGVVTHAM